MSAHRPIEQPMTWLITGDRNVRFAGIASLHDAGYDSARIAHTLGLDLSQVRRHIDDLERFR